MTYRTIVVELDDSREAEKRLGIAASLAVANEAHVVGVTRTNGGLAQASGPAETSRLRNRFQHAMDRPGVRSCEIRTLEGDAACGVSLQGCYCDLLILGQDPGHGQPVQQHVDFLEFVVLNAGCPVLVVPGQQMRAGGDSPLKTGAVETEAHTGSHVIIGWNASRSAGRAVRDAMPILVRATKVHLVVINAGSTQGKQGLHGEEPGADMALYLSRHGVDVEVVQLTVDVDAGKALLSFADRFSCDLIVAGGMAHHAGSSLFGGATRTLLEHAHLPVLMSH